MNIEAIIGQGSAQAADTAINNLTKYTNKRFRCEQGKLPSSESGYFVHPPTERGPDDTSQDAGGQQPVHIPVGKSSFFRLTVSPVL